MKPRTKKPCRLCSKPIVPTGGRLRWHKCPHGVPCFGSQLAAQSEPSCIKCRKIVQHAKGGVTWGTQSYESS